MTYKLNGKCIHIEVMFPDHKATSVIMGETVFYRERSFQNPKVQLMEMDVNVQDMRKMQSFAKECAQKQIPFNKSGFYRCVIPLMGRKTTHDKYFCSEYICCMFQKAGYLSELKPWKTTPTIIYNQLKELGTMHAPAKNLDAQQQQQLQAMSPRSQPQSKNRPQQLMQQVRAKGNSMLASNMFTSVDSKTKKVMYQLTNARGVYQPLK
jgi:hypothetical protein